MSIIYTNLKVAQPWPKVAQRRTEVAQRRPEVAQPRAKVAQPQPQATTQPPTLASPIVPNRSLHHFPCLLRIRKMPFRNLT